MNEDKAPTLPKPEHVAAAMAQRARLERLSRFVDLVMKSDGDTVQIPPLANLRPPESNLAKKEKREKMLRLFRAWKEKGCDEEIAHGDADDMLLDYIDDPEITEAFGAFPKWYA